MSNVSWTSANLGQPAMCREESPLITPAQARALLPAAKARLDAADARRGVCMTNPDGTKDFNNYSKLMSCNATSGLNAAMDSYYPLEGNVALAELLAANPKPAESSHPKEINYRVGLTEYKLHCDTGLIEIERETKKNSHILLWSSADDRSSLYPNVMKKCNGVPRGGQ